MVVRIRFQRGPRVERRKGKNSRIAWLAAGVLTLGSVSCLVLSVWRIGVDFGWAGEFVFPDESVLSHWQVWLVGALLIQLAAWKLNRYGKPKVDEFPQKAATAKTDKNKISASA